MTNPGLACGQEITVLRGGRPFGPGSERIPFTGPVDLLIHDGVIADIAPAGQISTRSGTVLDVSGCWVLPGLWDNHVHMVQWALTAQRCDLTGTTSPHQAAAQMAAAEALADGRRVGVGFRDALWSDRPTREILDEATGEVPTYLINADVHSVWLNSAALRREGMTAADGVLREEDAFEISRRLNAAAAEHADRAVREAMAQAARRGVTGFVDFDMAWNADAWPRRAHGGALLQRVEAAIYPEDLDRAIDEGLRSGSGLPGTAGLAQMGSVKIISDGSLGTRTAACSQPYADGSGSRGGLTVSAREQEEILFCAAGSGWDAAIHAIGDVAVTTALNAFATTGARGSVEHVQLIRHADLARFHRLGIVASVQPQHAVDDQILADRLWSAQTSLAYPLASLVHHEARVRFGSDAPVSPLDPWQGIAAAVARTARGAEPGTDPEAVDVAIAVRASSRSELMPGEPADFVVCGIDPARADTDVLRNMPIAATVLAGTLTALG